MATIPDQYLDLMTQKKSFANLATVQPDGTPQVTPVWFEWKDGKILVNTARGRVKSRNMEKNAAVAMAVSDPDNPYRHVQVRGRVANVREEGADAHIDFLANKYMGVDKYPYRRPGEVRVIFEIEPTSFSVMG